MALLSVVLLPVVLFSGLIACLPDSHEDRWLRSFPKPYSIPVDVDNNGTPTRTAFVSTAYLHEQHAKIGLDDKTFKILQAQGAKPCPRSAQADPSNPGETNTNKPPSTKAAEKQDCLMVQPWLPRNLILRGKVVTADPNLKPEVEAKFQTRAHMPNPEDFALIRRLNLQNCNFDYADFSESALPKADLSYASLKQAVLFKSRLDHARMKYIQAEKANLQRATLNGADLRPDIFGRRCRLRGELLDLGGHDGKAAPGLTGAGGLNGRVQSQDVCLESDLFDCLDDLADPF